MVLMDDGPRHAIIHLPSGRRNLASSLAMATSLIAIGPITVEVAGKRYDAGSVTLDVVAGRPGAIGSNQRAIFYGEHPRGALNFRRGTYVELELVGRDACIEIDNWDPRIECLNCADLNGSVGAASWKVF